LPYVGNTDGSFNGVRYQKDVVVGEGGPLSRADLEYLASDEFQRLRWEDEVESDQLPSGVYIGEDGYAYDNPEDAGAEAPEEGASGEAAITRAAELGIEAGAPAEESDEPDFTEELQHQESHGDDSGESVVTRANELGIEPGAPAEESDEDDSENAES
jgi:hypothetical protein